MKIGICFGGYIPLHQGHMDVIMKAKKQTDKCLVIVCGYDNEPRALEVGLPLRRRVSLVRKSFKDDEQIVVTEINDTKLGIDESMSEHNWDVWTLEAMSIAHKIFGYKDNEYHWYVGESVYCDALGRRFCATKERHVIHLIDRLENPVSGTEIRQNPIKYWNKIALPFRCHFSTNILITGTASEGKSTLTRDIAHYFGIPYVEEYGRQYMLDNCKTDEDLTVNDFNCFLANQRQLATQKIKSAENKGVFISDTDNLVTLMYAKAYSTMDNIDITEDDYNNILLPQAKSWQRGISWDKIFLLPPKNKFVNDGARYMAQSSIEERTKNFNILVDLLHQFGWWNKVEMLNGDYEENFNTVKSFIKSKTDGIW